MCTIGKRFTTNIVIHGIAKRQIRPQAMVKKPIEITSFIKLFLQIS